MKRLQSAQGFTLVELMVTTSILIIGLAILLVSLVQCSILNRIVSDRTVAITHAQYVLEAIRNATSENYANAHTGIHDYRWDLDSAELANQGITSLSNEEINTVHNHQVDGTLNLNILNVTVTVSWEEHRASATTAPSNITLVTFIGNPAP